MKRQLYLPLILTLLATLVFGALPLGQQATVYAAPDTVTIRPISAGDETNLTIGGTTPAASNWESVDEDPSDDDVTYVYATNTQTYETDLYNLADTSLTGTINSVTVYINCRALVTPAQASAYTRIKTNSVAYNGTEITLTTLYSDGPYSTTYTTNPQTTAAWTWTEVNALQAGVGLRQPKTTGGTRDSLCTQVWVIVDYTPAALPSISNTPNFFDFGPVNATSTPNTGTGHFTITNSSGVTIDITIKCNGWSHTAGSYDWAYGASAEDTARLKGSNDQGGSGGSSGAGAYDIIVPTGETGILFCDDVATTTTTIKWELQLEAPSSFTHGDPQTTTVTLTATQA